MSTDQETRPKRVDGECDGAAGGDRGDTPASPPVLEQLIPAGATSAEKKQLFVDSSRLFSGHYDAASICSILVSLDETDLRELRDQLHTALPAAVPATAGRPMTRRNAGNIHGLAEDCWALGYSAAQGVLTHRAESATLRPAGRTPLAPPTPANPAEQSEVAASLQEIISTQIRLERETTEMRTRLAVQEARSQRMVTLEEENFQLREELAVHESRIEQLERQVIKLSADLQRGAHPPAGDSHLAGSGATADSGGATATTAPAAPVAASSDRTTAASTGHTATASAERTAAASTERTAAAREVAAALDLRALGEAIASALQSRAGDSDSEPDLDTDRELVGGAGPGAGTRQSRRQAVRSADVPGAAVPAATQAQRQNQVTPVRALTSFATLRRRLNPAERSSFWRASASKQLTGMCGTWCGEQCRNSMTFNACLPVAQLLLLPRRIA